MAFSKIDDHWAFLEDIEAPMWVDLTSEANSNNKDIDDKWFYTTHQFHQCSSSQLKSAFSHSGDESTTLDLVGSSSPNLPSSVSKSRGKQYMSKKWKTNNQKFSFDKPHPVKGLSRKSLSGKPGPGDKIRHKSNFMHSKKAFTLKPSVVCESSSSGKAISNCSKTLSTCADPGSSLSSQANKAGESNPTSTVTSGSGQQQQLKSMDASSQAFGHTSGLLSVMKISLRKSRIMRQASRVEIKNDEKQSKGRNSTSTKSSIGSSSNPAYDAKKISTSTSARPKERTPDSRNMGKMTYVAKGKINSSGMVNASTDRVKEGASNNRRGGQTNIGKSTHQEAAKQKVPYRASSTKALVPSRVNERNSTIVATKPKKKTATGESHNLVGNGKENVTQKISVRKKFKGRGIVGGGGIVGKSQEGTKQSFSVESDMARMVGSKGKGRGQDNLQKPNKLIHGVHFR